MRNKILKVAFNLMCKKTIKDVSMREIAQCCSVSKAALYYHFKDKDEICYEIMKYIFDKQKKDIQSYLSSNKSLKEFVYEIFEKTFQINGKNSVSFFFHFLDYVKTNNALKKRLVPYKQKNDEYVKKIFSKEVKRKTISENKVDLGYHIFRAFSGYIVLVTEKLNKINYREVANSLLVSIDYKEVENKI